MSGSTSDTEDLTVAELQILMNLLFTEDPPQQTSHSQQSTGCGETRAEASVDSLDNPPQLQWAIHPGRDPSGTIGIRQQGFAPAGGAQALRFVPYVKRKRSRHPLSRDEQKRQHCEVQRRFVQRQKACLSIHITAWLRPNGRLTY
ncbi:hypothetical protein BBJ28_00017498 [Nothophytophthora sp. Chile5]|nr:hypothetical protein BBJ28_00017498 [Nothophytophthora sp. Chile5]